MHKLNYIISYSTSLNDEWETISKRKLTCMLGVKSLLLKQQLPINVDITGGMVIKGIIKNPIYIVTIKYFLSSKEI